MKHILLVILLVLALGPIARAMPADTVKGQTRFVQQLSNSLCEQLTAEAQKNDFAKLSETETKILFNKAMYAAMADNMSAFQAVQAQADKSKGYNIGEEIGRAAVLRLMTTCAAARPLLIQMGLKAANTDLTAAERPVLTPIAQSICRRLDEENAKQPFEQRAPAVRSKAMEQVMTSVVMANTEELTGYYGEDAINDEEQMKQIGVKTALIVLEQCPSYLVLLSGDQEGRQSVPARAATARKPAAHPARRPTTPAKKPVKK